MVKDAVAKLISAMPVGLWRDALAVAEHLRSCAKVTVATHIDADGVAAASIAKLVLERMGVAHEVLFFKKLDDTAVESLRLQGADVTWFTDLGSGSSSRLSGLPAVISDHHVPDSSGGGPRSGAQALLSDFAGPRQVNPHLHGISGASDLSGAGATFLVAIAVDERNFDLAPLAILGSVGDLQDQKTRRLEGLNRDILTLAVACGFVDAEEDIRYFGRETRPLFKMLEYSSDPFLPGITGNEQECISFLLSLGIELKEGDAWRTWSMLSEDERAKIVTALRDHLHMRRRRQETIDRLTGEAYSFTREEPGSPVRDVKEFATLLNACGRHGRAEVGLRICTGDRGAALTEGYALLRDHRSALSRALELAKTRGITRLKHIQFFDAGDDIEETIVGTVAGMLLGGSGADRTAPIVAFADSMEPSDEQMTKVSSRGTQELVSRGMDLSAAMRAVAGELGGVGGGHNIAAGATIPATRKKEFLDLLDAMVGSQLSR
jgi:single-stranded-DNA-specific exonuclease